MSKKTNLSMCVVTLVFLLGMTCTAAGQIIYVDYNAPGPIHDGISWPTAYKYLQDALAVALPGSEIWVAACTYRPDEDTVHPTGTGDRNAAFGLKNNVAIYGGFPSGGDWFDRDPDKYPTILSGDLSENDVEVADPCDLLNDPCRADNSYHVVFSNWTAPTAILDGFRITGGNANGEWVTGGGGMFIDFGYGGPTIANCTFIRNTAYAGGGISNQGGGSTMRNCNFIGNWANQTGGGIHNYYYGGPTLIECMFSENSAGMQGGGMYNLESSPTLTGCTFSGNSARDGGGVHNFTSSPVMINCEFDENSARASGGGMSNNASTLKLGNCTFSGNLAGHDGGGMSTVANSIAELADCAFTGNWTSYYGGGMNNSQSNPILTSCKFTGNRADSSGGGMRNDRANTTLINCIFDGNKGCGGGMQNYYSDPNITNCTFTGNRGKSCPSGTENDHSIPRLTNCILWNDTLPELSGTPVVTYCDIQGGWSGKGNIDEDPCFVDPGYWDPNGTPVDADDDFWVAGDYHLLPDSSCIDAGDPDGDYQGQSDIDGNCRDVNGVDIGADEVCVPTSYMTYNDWVILGRPDCWCKCYQCDGDADGATDGVLKYRVALNDLNLIIANWKKKITDPTLNPCADIGHKPEGALKYRVGLNDLNILIANWKKKDTDLPGNCPRP